MSIEEDLQKLTAEITKLYSAISEQNNGGKISSNPDMEELKRHTEAKKAQVAAASTDKADDTTADDTTKVEDATTENDKPVLATRQQYVFFKDTKTGQVIQKGEVVPKEGNPVGVKKGKFEELAEKYNFNPATGAKNEAKATKSDDDDLDDDTAEESSLSREEVKAQLVKYMKMMKGDREVGLKVLQKFGATGTTDLKVEDFQACYDLTQKLIDKQSKPDAEPDLDDI